MLLDTKLPQQAGNVVAIYYVAFLSEIWQQFNMAFSIEGYVYVLFYVLFAIFILHSRESELYRYENSRLK